VHEPFLQFIQNGLEIIQNAFAVFSYGNCNHVVWHSVFLFAIQENAVAIICSAFDIISKNPAGIPNTLATNHRYG
jgi:hypothetical protein